VSSEQALISPPAAAAGADDAVADADELAEPAGLAAVDGELDAGWVASAAAWVAGAFVAAAGAEACELLLSRCAHGKDGEDGDAGGCRKGVQSHGCSKRSNRDRAPGACSQPAARNGSVIRMSGPRTALDPREQVCTGVLGGLNPLNVIDAAGNLAPPGGVRRVSSRSGTLKVGPSRFRFPPRTLRIL
jgi:hypothetical protein